MVTRHPLKRVRALTVGTLVLAVGAVAGLPVEAHATSAKYMKAEYSKAVYKVTGTKRVKLTYPQWKKARKHNKLIKVHAKYYKYGWDTAVIADTNWPGPNSWVHLTAAEYKRAGRPHIRKATTYLPGSRFVRWGTSSQIMLLSPSGRYHKWQYSKAKAAGLGKIETYGNHGFERLSWSPKVAYMTNLKKGHGSWVSAAKFKRYGKPHVKKVKHFPGDRFWRYSGKSAIHYDGLMESHTISKAKWRKAGKPKVHVKKAPANKRQKVIKLAKKYVGTKYKYGGSSPKTGWDCSGFTRYIYKKVGVNLPHSASGQRKAGKAVSKSHAKAGDLVATSSHVGIYDGHGKMYDAGNSRVDTIHRTFGWMKPVRYVRVLP